jgi:cation diffusion facilitator CzcD-associated flavoprotein CzcO
MAELSMTKPLNILIVGGGIGGLTTAIALLTLRLPCGTPYL